MRDFTEALQRCLLFQDVSPSDLDAMLGCLNGRTVDFERGEVILAAEERADQVGIVLAGQVQVVRDDYFGNRSIQARLAPGELFGEAFACAGVDRLPVTVEGASSGQALLIQLQRIMETCCNACAFHQRMVMNLLRAMAARNLQLNRRLEVAAQRTTRDKLMTYLQQQARQAKSNCFTIPFDRQGLADYLCVDRSALSAEIGKLRREGVIESERSTFRLIQK